MWRFRLLLSDKKFPQLFHVKTFVHYKIPGFSQLFATQVAWFQWYVMWIFRSLSSDENVPQIRHVKTFVHYKIPCFFQNYLPHKSHDFNDMSCESSDHSHVSKLFHRYTMSKCLSNIVFCLCHFQLENLRNNHSEIRIWFSPDSRWSGQIRTGQLPIWRCGPSCIEHESPPVPDC